jgi:hypothetical protein
MGALETFPSGSPWTLFRSVKVLRSAAPVFSLRCDEYVFSGGAHGADDTRYLNFDPATGQVIKLSAVLKDGSMARLTAIAEVHFRQERKLSPTANVEDENFTFPGGHFTLNDNYGFGEKALLFFFNNYEIADHAHGTTLVEIPYAEIRDLIRPEAGESNGAAGPGRWPTAARAGSIGAPPAHAGAVRSTVCGGPSRRCESQPEGWSEVCLDSAGKVHDGLLARG